MSEIILIFPRHDAASIVQPRYDVPLSILCLGSYLKKEGFDVKLIDQRMTNDLKGDIRKYITNETVCVGISSMTGPQIGEGLEIAKFVRELNEKLPIVWGGVHPSLMPHQTLENENVDIVVIGEGEDSLKNLIYALINKESLSQVRGIAYIENGEYIYTGAQELINPNYILDLSYNLLNMENYIVPAFGSNEPSLATATSRGCPYNCNFCYHTGLKAFKKWRFCDPEIICRHLQTLNERLNINSFVFYDDNFYVNKDHVLKIAKLLVENQNQFEIYNTNLRADNALMYTLDEWKYLYDAGFDFLFLGVESGSNSVLKTINKGFKTEHIIKINEILRQAKINAIFSFMIGLPDETIEDVKKTFSLMARILDENELASVNFSIFCPYPGTKLYARCHELGMESPSKLEEWKDYVPNKVTFDKFDIEYLKFVRKVKNCSTIIDYKRASDGTKNSLIRFMIKIYSKILRMRIKHDFYKLMFESYIFNFLKNTKHKRLVRFVFRLR